MPTLERTHLAIIQAVDQLGSLTAAAEQLHLTQSALSHAMRKLEEALGIPVWHREGRTLRPTQAGIRLLDLANRLLPQFTQAEAQLQQFARGQRGTLRIGMECHPCYQWLLRVVAPYLSAWPDVDVDVIQKFKFGGFDALSGYDIDILVTPDPVHGNGLRFEPVFDYEQVLVVGPQHPLRQAPFAEPAQLAAETLITYPVPVERLDIYTRFFIPAGISPRQHKTIETTDIMLQMVTSGRGVAALPRWLVEEYAARLDIHPVRLGRSGMPKQIFLGYREAEAGIDYLRAFVVLARSHTR